MIGIESNHFEFKVVLNTNNMADVVSHGDNGSLFHKLINVLIGLEEKIVIVDCLLVVETT
jgi:hypothetical protein